MKLNLLRHLFSGSSCGTVSTPLSVIIDSALSRFAFLSASRSYYSSPVYSEAIFLLFVELF